MPVVKDNGSNLADASINQDFSRCHFLLMANAVFGDFNHIPVVGNHTVFGRDSHRLSQSCMFDKHTVFSVDRNKILRVGQCKHQLKVFLRGMARYMKIRMAVINHLCPPAV